MRWVKNMRYIFFFQAEDGIRGLVRSGGLGDVYKSFFFQAEVGIRDLVRTRGLGQSFDMFLSCCTYGWSPMPQEAPAAIIAGQKCFKKHKSMVGPWRYSGWPRPAQQEISGDFE